MPANVALGNLAPHAFLRRHWQKSPLLIRQAFADFKCPITVKQLLALACQANVEARLVRRVRTRPGWRVQHGPFSAGYLRTLPSSNWTLLIQDCDKHVSQLADFLGCFNFIPNWRIDDLMISYAVAGGSVGPHTDAYDVFLLQAEGRRRWDINRKPQQPVSRPGLDLKLVRAFRPEHRWVLEPGDMLYLPPGVAHHGVALGKCLTFSIGFRAPSVHELFGDLYSVLMARLDPDLCYADPDLKPAGTDPGLITRAARAAIRRQLRAAGHMSVAQIDEWFGRLITEPKPWLAPRPASRKLRTAALWRKLSAHATLAHSPAARYAWCNAPRHSIRLFVSGHCYRLPRRLAPMARLLCRRRSFTLGDLRLWQHEREACALLVELYNSGLLHWR